MGATNAPVPIVLQAQGRFAVGGTIVQSPGTYQLGKAGSDVQTLHGDHALVG